MFSIRKLSLIWAALALFVPSIAFAAPMTKSQIEQHLIGKTLYSSRNGIPIRLYFNLDKTVKMKALIISASGTWEYQDNGLCMDLNSGPKKGVTCMEFEELGHGKYRNSEGMILTVK